MELECLSAKVLISKMLAVERFMKLMAAIRIKNRAIAEKKNILLILPVFPNSLFRSEWR
jgi:hypothetical protein